MSAFVIADDVSVPFQLERPSLRGRVVRLGRTVDTVLTRHAYPEPVSKMLGELLTLAATLSGSLKFAGVFSLQTRSDGPVSLMVADCTHDGRMRGYARFDREALNDAGGADASALLGKGVLALNVRQEDQKDDYQGIVELTGGVTASMLNYFRNSEQIKTGLTVHVDRLGDGGPEGGAWRAGGVMLQRLPDERRNSEEGPIEDWRRSMILMGSVTEAELVDPLLPPDRLLFRLFHEEEPRVYPPIPLAFGCRCSRERVASMLKGFPPEEHAGMKTDEGIVEVTCQFCSTRYDFDDADLAALDAPAAATH